MNVMNRKLFANRDARRKLASMGGIVTSSPELINTVQSFSRALISAFCASFSFTLLPSSSSAYISPSSNNTSLVLPKVMVLPPLLKIRSERRRDEVIEKGATAKGPGVFADTLEEFHRT